MLLRLLIGRALRRARLAQGRTLREVAGAARVSLPYLSELERGRKEASSEVLAAICRALDMRLRDLLDEASEDLARLEPDALPARPVPAGRPFGLGVHPGDYQRPHVRRPTGRGANRLDGQCRVGHAARSRTAHSLTSRTGQSASWPGLPSGRPPSVCWPSHPMGVPVTAWR